MSIPEVGSRSRLIAFLKNFFLFKGEPTPIATGPISVATTDYIAFSGSTVSSTADLNTVKAIGKWPLQLHQNQADGYGLYIKRDNDTDAETYPLTWVRELNTSSTEPVLRVDQYSEVTALYQGYGTTFELWTPGPNGSNSSLWVDNRGRLTMGGDQGLSQGNGTHMVDVKTTSYFDSVTFTGTGLDDLDKWSSGYTGLSGNGVVSYRVQIDANGTPDTFKWSTDGGSTWTATGVNCSTSVTLLADGIYVKFGATTGHTIGDYWDVDVQVVNPLRIRDASGTSIFRVLNDGTIWKPEVPGFSAQLTADQTPAAATFTTLNMGTEIWDQSDDYNTGTYTFTAPQQGKYLFTAHVRFRNINNETSLQYGYAIISTSNRSYSLGILSFDDVMESTVYYYGINGACVADMDANDTATLQIYIKQQGSGFAQASGVTAWQGYQIG